MRKWLGRFGEGIVSGIFSFIICSVMAKLIFKADNWLYITLVISIPKLVIIPLKYYIYVDDKKRRKWAIIGTSVFLVGLITLFVTGVIMSIDSYLGKTFTITFMFGFMTLTAPIHEELDKKRIANKTKSRQDVDVVV